MGWFRRKPNVSLLETLERVSLDRWKAQMEADTRRAELEVRKMELEAQYAEHLAEARIKEKAAADELRQKRKEVGKKFRDQQLEAKREGAKVQCRVCENDHDINLSTADIQYHHAGHPANFTPGMFS